MLNISDKAFSDAIKQTYSEAYLAGKADERERIIEIINKDAVIMTYIPVQFMGLIVEAIER